MPKTAKNLLKNTACINLTCPAGKNQDFLPDGDNLRLMVRKTGTKSWQFRFRLGGKPDSISLGIYPDVSLGDARELRDVCKALVKQGIHPREHFEKQKQDNLEVYKDKYKFSTLFYDMVEYHCTMIDKVWSDSNRKRYEGIYNNYLKQDLADKSIMQLTDSDLLYTLKRIKTNPVKLISGKKDTEKYNRTTTMIYAKTILSLTYQYAYDERGYKGDNPVDKFRNNKIFKKTSVRHHKPVHNDDLGSFWHQVKQLPQLQDQIFMTLDLLTGLRVGQLAETRWSWFMPTRKLIAFPKEFVKTDIDFLNPLPDMVVDMLNELKKIVKPDKDDLVFVGGHNAPHYNKNRPRELIKEHMGFNYATAHGNRTILKLNASRFSGINNFAINYQMTHTTATRDATERAYLGDYDWLDERRALANWMIGFLDQQEQNYLQVKQLGERNGTVPATD